MLDYMYFMKSVYLKIPNMKRISAVATLIFSLFCVSYTQGKDSLEINKITVNYKAVKLPLKHRTLELISSNNDVLIEFMPLKGDSIHYEYQLQGYEMDWVKSSFPSARYMWLRQGKYDFIIKSYSKKKEIAHFYLKFDVKPSISEVWWFYPVVGLSAFLLVLGGVYLFFLYNFRQKMKVQHLRNKIAADLHDEIGSTLSSIAISSNVVNNKLKGFSPEVQKILSQIKLDSEETVHSIRDTVWALNPDNDSFETLIEKIRSYAFQILPNKEIKVVFENKITGKISKLSIEHRKNLFLLLKEIINNIAKHSEANKAEIVFERKNDMISVTIKDNGKGFDANIVFEGNGLKNLQKRANESLFDLEISSVKGKGTTIKVETMTV